MPITVEIRDKNVDAEIFRKVFSYFQHVDEKFSPFKDTSEVTLINEGKIGESERSEEMKEIFHLSEETKKITDGYFDVISPEGKYNPSGLVKGWAIYNAAKTIKEAGLENFFVDAGGDIEARGQYWKVGIRNPFKREENVKILYIKDMGVATSGTYIRGQHIYDSKNNKKTISEILSLTVIGPNIYEADRFATAAFAMGEKGIMFIEKLDGFEGYMIDKNGLGTETSGFEKYAKPIL